MSDTAAAAVQAIPGSGRELTPAVGMLAGVVGVTSLLTGLVLVATSLAGHAFGAWASPSSLTPGMIGAAMLGVSPGLFAVNRATTWEQARTLVWPLVVVLVGQFAVCLLDGGSLQIVKGGPIVAVFFSLGWVAIFAVLALSALIGVARQFTRARGQDPAREVPLPAWTKPSLAVLGSSWLGIGAGLVLLPGFWSRFVPWSVNRLDAQSLGLWALALGIGVLGTLAEDDLARTRPALLASTTTALTAAVVLAAHPGTVHWHTGGAASLLALLAGMLVSGLTGRRLLAGRALAPRPWENQTDILKTV